MRNRKYYLRRAAAAVILLGILLYHSAGLTRLLERALTASPPTAGDRDRLPRRDRTARRRRDLQDGVEAGTGRRLTRRERTLHDSYDGPQSRGADH